MEWLDLDHSLGEWLLFLLAIIILVAVKLYARKRRRQVAEADAAERQARREAMDAEERRDQD